MIKCQKCFKELNLSEKQDPEAFPEYHDSCVKEMIEESLVKLSETVNLVYADNERPTKTQNTILLGKNGGMVDLMCMESLNNGSSCDKDYMIKIEVIFDKDTRFPRIAVKMLKIHSGNYPEDYKPRKKENGRNTFMEIYNGINK